MLKVYNKQALTRNQRFQRALLYGGAAAIASIVIYVILAEILPFESSILYIGFGYGIGYVIRTYGKGVQPRFSILGAVLATCVFLIGDVVYLAGLEVFTNPALFVDAFLYNISSMLDVSRFGFINLLFRAAGVYFAYVESRIV
jgi:hypothetical protein